MVRNQNTATFGHSGGVALCLSDGTADWANSPLRSTHFSRFEIISGEQREPRDVRPARYFELWRRDEERPFGSQHVRR